MLNDFHLKLEPRVKDDQRCKFALENRVPKSRTRHFNTGSESMVLRSLGFW